MAPRRTTPKIYDVKYTRPPEPEGVWVTEGRSGSESYWIRFGELRIDVHHHIHYSPEQWLVTCRPVGFEPKLLGATDIEDAKREALSMVRAIVDNWSNGMAAFGGAP